MIGLAPPGQPRPWQLNAAVTTLRATFPGAKVHIDHYDRRAAFAEFVVSQPVTITDTRELLTMSTSWAHRRLRITAEVLAACPQEADVAALIAAAAPKMERGVVVEVGETRQAEAEAKTRPEPGQVSRGSRGPAKTPGSTRDVAERTGVSRVALIRRGPRLGRRVSAEELQPLLRGVVIR